MIRDLSGVTLTAKQREEIDAGFRRDGQEAGDALSSAVADLNENLRARVYALFCRLGFADLPGVASEDLVTLAVIDRFLDWKTGEAWHELMAEFGVRRSDPSGSSVNSDSAVDSGLELGLEASGTARAAAAGWEATEAVAVGAKPSNGEAVAAAEVPIRPVSPDVEAMLLVDQANLKKAAHVRHLQHEILDSELQQDAFVEQKYYAEVRIQHITQIRIWMGHSRTVNVSNILNSAPRDAPAKGEGDHRIPRVCRAHFASRGTPRCQSASTRSD